jgi:hypothetical protein
MALAAVHIVGMMLAPALLAVSVPIDTVAMLVSITLILMVNDAARKTAEQGERRERPKDYRPVVGSHDLVSLRFG